MCGLSFDSVLCVYSLTKKKNIHFVLSDQNTIHTFASLKDSNCIISVDNDLQYINFTLKKSMFGTFPFSSITSSEKQ